MCVKTMFEFVNGLFFVYSCIVSVKITFTDITDKYVVYECFGMFIRSG